MGKPRASPRRNAQLHPHPPTRTCPQGACRRRQRRPIGARRDAPWRSGALLRHALLDGDAEQHRRRGIGSCEGGRRRAKACDSAMAAQGHDEGTPALVKVPFAAQRPRRPRVHRHPAAEPSSSGLQDSILGIGTRPRSILKADSLGVRWVAVDRLCVKNSTHRNRVSKFPR